MSIVVDDHLLGDLLADVVPGPLRRLLHRHDVATTNLYLFRICLAVLSSRGGVLTGSWSEERRRQVARVVTVLPPDVSVVPMQVLALRMAELVRDYGLSALGAESVAASEVRGARLCVWEGDDGLRIRACCEELGIGYQTIARQ